MSRFWICLAVCLAAAAGASAQVISITTSRMVTAQDLYDELNVSGEVGDTANQYSFPNGTSPQYQAIENYQVSADVTPSDIVFANNVTSQGFYSSTSTSTSIGVNYTNVGNSSVNVTLNSTIVPGGFGFYMDAPQNNPTLSGASLGDVNRTPASSVATFNNISGFVDAGPGGSVGYAGFTFQIFNNGSLIDSYSANVALYLSLNASNQAVYSVALMGAPALNGFGLVTPAGSDQEVGYQWDTTNVAAYLGALAPGQTSTLTYVSTVIASSYIQNTQNCQTEDVCPQLLAYSGFGDPIRTGAGSGSDPYFPTFQLTLPTFNPCATVNADGSCNASLGGPTIAAVTPSLPLPGVAPAPFVPIPASILDAVPEPETWALMLLGTAFAGGVLRRRRTKGRAQLS